MRKAQKREILDLIDSLHQIHEEIKKALEQKNVILAQDMVSVGQESAISLGESIENTEGEGHVTVSYIEEYCELLYCVYEDLNKYKYSENKTYKALRKQLIKIENSVKNDIIVRKEIVFFPYKASMWDSLESIYLTAKDDPDCDAYCIAIPYYDLNADGSFGEMHYEGGDYPNNIEVIDYETYNFEERRPDQIYIHNGYDNWNLVTSVHPRFYASNLKKYTEQLIYIPYFILGEIEPDNQTVIDGIKHFIWQPGVVYADKVVVQSEKMKQIYVNEYFKAAKAYGLTGKHLDREYLEQKFLGLGSPKIDKVLNTRKQDLEIPSEWLKVIEKPDGSWKKIIFYNTGIGALLMNNEKWVDKIEDVLRIFNENQKEVALLWRPHPLIENAMKSMRPGILQRYMQIKNRYINEGWGIYDDTADMDRAVVISDAYYGDASSIVQLYQKTGKPIMHQNIEIIHGGI